MIRSASSRPLLKTSYRCAAFCIFLEWILIKPYGDISEANNSELNCSFSSSGKLSPLGHSPEILIISPQRYQLICPHKIHRFTVTTCFLYGIARDQSDSISLSTQLPSDIPFDVFIPTVAMGLKIWIAAVLSGSISVLQATPVAHSKERILSSVSTWAVLEGNRLIPCVLFLPFANIRSQFVRQYGGKRSPTCSLIVQESNQEISKPAHFPFCCVMLQSICCDRNLSGHILLSYNAHCVMIALPSLH